MESLPTADTISGTRKHDVGNQLFQNGKDSSKKISNADEKDRDHCIFIFLFESRNIQPKLCCWLFCSFCCCSAPFRCGRLCNNTFTNGSAIKDHIIRVPQQLFECLKISCHIESFFAYMTTSLAKSGSIQTLENTDSCRTAVIPNCKLEKRRPFKTQSAEIQTKNIRIDSLNATDVLGRPHPDRRYLVGKFPFDKFHFSLSFIFGLGSTAQFFCR